MRSEIWPFSIWLLRLNTANQIAEYSRQPEFDVDKKNPCLPKDLLKSIQGRLHLQTWLRQVSRQAAVECKGLCWVNICEDGFGFYIAWMPVILADPHCQRNTVIIF